MQIPFWFVLLAVFGAVSLATLVILAVAMFYGWLFKNEPVRHVGQIKRRIFN